jgi:hypothetical protein
MTVLISTKRGFINAVVEPQFQEAVTGYMVTVEFSDYDDVQKLSPYLKGDILFDQNNRMFPFKSFIHLEDLTSHFKRRKLWTRLQENKVDFSEKPVAYSWIAYYTGENQDEGDPVDESTYFGNCLADDAQDIRWSFEHTPDVVYLYPLYELPAELTEAQESCFEFES